MLEEDLLKIGEGNAISPFAVELHLTNACNHRCKWCIYSDLNKEKNATMPREKAEKLIKDLRLAGCHSVLFSGGGDPLAYPYILEIIELARKEEMDCAMISNGGLLDNQDLYRLSNSLSLLRISVDSYNEESYKSIHNPTSSQDTFERLCNNIKKLVKLKKQSLKIILTYILDHETVEHIESFYKTALSLGVDGIDIKTNHYLPFAEKKAVSSLAEKKIKLLKDLTKEGQDIRVDFDLVKRREAFIHGTWANLCFQCVIEPDGEIYPCCHTIAPEYLIGNVNEKSFGDIWFSNEHNQMIKNYYDIQQECPICHDSSSAKIIKRLLEKLDLKKV